MKLHALLAVTAGLLLGADPLPPKDLAAETEGLRGEWRLVSTQDEKHTDRGSEHIRMVVQGDARVVFQVGDRTTNHGILQFSRDGKEKCLDEELASGKTVRGVYERDEDDLVICFDEAGKPRPAGLTPRGTQWVERWRRVTP
jgi:uncharacterized protein (TIGR03067 family)